MYEESVQVIVLAEDIPTKLLRLTEKEKASPHDEVSTVRYSAMQYSIVQYVTSPCVTCTLWP